MALLAPAACNALTGASDLDTKLEPGGAPTGCPSCAPPPPPPPAAVDACADAVAPPSFCAGLVFYARLDGTTTSAEDDVASSFEGGAPEIAFDAGKFGGAGVFVGTSSATYWDATRYPAAVGTVAMWVKPTWSWPPPAGGIGYILFKPTPTRAPSPLVAGPAFGADTIGLNADVKHPDGGGAGVIAPAAAVAPRWHDLDWNHVVMTWDRPGAPTLGIAVNGGGADGGSMGFSTTAAWTADVAAVWFRLSSPSAPAEALLDDVALWNRVLDAAEIAAIHASAAPIGDACGL